MTKVDFRASVQLFVVLV